MLNRRSFMHKGMSAAALGFLARRGMAFGGLGADQLGSGALPLNQTRPIRRIPLHPDFETVGGLPFAKWFSGDAFSNTGIPFHQCENCFKGGKPPAPTEEIDLAIVGAGISGLSTAYLLRDHAPVVFEHQPRFGGTSVGETWAGTNYSLGGAYVITPDSGSFLQWFYNELGMPDVVRVDSGDNLIERGGKILDDFWSGAGQPPEDVLAFQKYAEVVQHMANSKYPEIPLIEGKDNQWIIELDKRTLKHDIEERMGMPVPHVLAAAIQAYCYSSFCAGWEEISAAGGWNFLAAEEFGRWVCPGGNSYMVQTLWNKLRFLEDDTPPGSKPRFLRAGCRVVDVRLAGKKRVQVTYIDAAGDLHSLLAKRVVMCCSKHLCKYIMPEVEQLDNAKWNAMHQIHTRGYVVANVLLDAPVDLDFYDVFLLGEGDYPMNEGDATFNSFVTDMLSGHFARQSDVPRSVLTLYWPLPFDSGRFTLITDGAWRDYAERLAPQVNSMLGLLGVPERSVRQVRMTRWGHSVPYTRPYLIADGTVDHLRRPFEDRVYFVNQDNWGLPAVENCLLEAEYYAPQIAAGL